MRPVLVAVMVALVCAAPPAAAATLALQLVYAISASPK